MAQRGHLNCSPPCQSRHDRSATIDESCPLLAHPTPNNLESQASPPPAKLRPSSTPLPTAQLVCLCIIRLVDPIAFTQIFPYVNEMMAHLHLTNDPSRVGFYSGLAESVFSICSLFSIYQWARLSDVIGRRPVIFIGILGASLATVLFGLQRSLPGILLVRCIGNTAVIHSVLGEITDSTNRAIAFPVFALAWPFGSIIGPLIGGTFSSPANRFPNLFNHDFFRSYPYFLPGFMASVICLTGAIFGYVFLEETLPSKRRGYLKSITEDHQEQKSAPYTFRMLISVPIIRALCLSGAGLSFTYTAFDVLFVLFCYSPIESGGLALSASEIGFWLAIAGFISCVIQLFVTPILLTRCDHVRVYNRCISLWPYCFLALPLLNMVARVGLPNMDHQAIVWCGIAALLALSRLGCLAFALSMILVNENAPTPDSLGATNGLVQFAMCFTRSFCPAFASALFASLAGKKILYGNLWVVIMASISYVCSLLGSQIERGRESSIVTHDSGLSE
ncbi:MFS general substrate transporter [Russula aff. rugulosa BPL654]|nr:MFS general substrate transporter [Russula aff. rugulosa BPL654]